LGLQIPVSKEAAPASGDQQLAEKMALSLEMIRLLRAGDICPICRRESLDYDGMLNLSCSTCGTVSGGCFT
jgi:hypothetical protein